jgi:hypothetical protein
MPANHIDTCSCGEVSDVLISRVHSFAWQLILDQAERAGSQPERGSDETTETKRATYPSLDVPWILQQRADEVIE